jgi:hypothetical protein
MLETCFVLNKGEEGIVDDELGLQQFLNVFPVSIDCLKAEVTIEGMHIGTSDNSNSRVGASFPMVELKLLDESTFGLRVLKSQIESSGSSHSTCSNNNKVIPLIFLAHTETISENILKILVINKNAYQGCSIFESILCNRLFISSLSLFIRLIFSIISFSFRLYYGTEGQCPSFFLRTSPYVFDFAF